MQKNLIFWLHVDLHVAIAGYIYSQDLAVVFASKQSMFLISCCQSVLMIRVASALPPEFLQDFEAQKNTEGQPSRRKWRRQRSKSRSLSAFWASNCGERIEKIASKRTVFLFRPLLVDVSYISIPTEVTSFL